MSVQQPAWLKRTRPCPFFSQGRCLFADSCNFLHDVKVKNSLSHPLPSSSQVNQPSIPPKPVFQPPSVVVDSASPLVKPASPESLVSPVQDSSRYSGLLSVLSDVIGPPSNLPAISATSLSPQSTARGPGVLESATDDVAHPETEQGDPGNLDPSIQFDSEATLVSPSGYETESCFPQDDDEPAAESLSMPNDTDSADENVTSYLVEESGAYVIGSESSSDDDADDHMEEDFTVVVPNRQSTLSSFSGASLLGSPRNNVFEPSSVGGDATDLLSPVELSAKLRPFPIPLLDPKLKRGDSIDSGYADADNWVGPPAFPRSPPRNLHSPVTFLSHSRQTSHSFPSFKDDRQSYDVGDVRLTSHGSIEDVKEVESDGCSEHGSEENEDATHVILDAYDDSPSEDQENAKACDPPQVTEHKVEHLHPSMEHDVDLCNRPSFVSDDDLSFKTALSVQSSYEDLGNASMVLPIKLDTLVSPTSGSTLNTSVSLHHDDANEPSGDFIVSEDSYGSPSFLAADPESHVHCVEVPEDPLRSNVMKHQISSLSTESCHGPFVVQDVLGLANGPPEIFQENIIDTIEDVSGVHLPTSAASVESLRSALPSKDLGHIPPGGESVCLTGSTPTSHVDQSLPTENWSEPNETIESIDPEREKFTQRLSFPLPPPFLPAECMEHSTLGGEDFSVVSEVTMSDLGGDGSKACTMSQKEEVRQLRSGSELTEKMRPSHLPTSGPPNSDADFRWRRSRAASDLTVKGKSSPMTISEGTPRVFKSPVLPVEQQGRFDPVDSLYDQYFDDSTPDNVSYPIHETTDISSALGEPSQCAFPQYQGPTFQREPSPYSNEECRDSGADSPRSETALRPLLTGRRSFLCSSLAELVPKTHADVKEASSARQSVRLQAREIGSTMVPLGFRRYKPQAQLSRITSLHTALPASQLREVLRIRTDLTREVVPQECSSATQVSFPAWSPLPAQSMSAPPTGGLRQLCLSSVITKRSSILSTQSSSIASSILSYHLFNASTPQSPSVSSTTSFSRNSLLSFSCQQIPEQTHHTPQRSLFNSPVLQVADNAPFAPQLPSPRHDLRSVSAPVRQSKSWRLSHYRAGSQNYSPVDNARRLSRRTSTLSLSYTVDEEQEIGEDGPVISHPGQSNVMDGMHPTPVLAPPVHAIATPKPTLLFAIASDDVEQVRLVLESGDAGPNDSVGPQSALAFTLTNDKLTHKPEIVKALLAYGANPSALRNPTLNPPPRSHGANEPSPLPPETTLEGMDPATRYFVARADATHTRQTSQLIYRSFFRPLTRVRYDVIGQDWALEQLFRVLSMHSQKLAVAPIVVLLCGPSGHGKSLLARKFGFLLDVPTHTVNMTTLRSAHDIWQSYSMSPYEEPSSCTLAEFLIENEGKRCVVVLDEIEKVEDQKALWSLLMPWELGRCSLEAGKRHVDARNVIWLATSNIGHELVFEYHEKRVEPDSRMSREDYVELTAMLRPRVSHCLGASLVSRVTTVLPFVPFTLDEKKAIAAEAIYAFAGEASKMSPQEVESLVMKALLGYHPGEGARSLHRAISSILVDAV